MKIHGSGATKPGTPGRNLRLVRAILWLVVLLTIVALPFRILSFGYLPDDDALRHAAKAVSGKPWSEILLLRPEITIDHNPGWHFLLAMVQRSTGWDTRQLVQFSVVSLFVLAAVAPLPWLRRPEAWIAALAIIAVAFPYVVDRAFLGRPLLVTVAAMIALLCIWTRRNVPWSRWALFGSAALMALSAYVHGSWYLLALIPAAFFLAREWRKAALLAACWIAGSLGGAILTGRPWAFLSESAMIPVWALDQKIPAEILVGEFQPLRSGYLPAIFIAGGVLMIRMFTRRPSAQVARDPILWLAVLGLLLGFRVARFWLDWGLPALALWLAKEIQELLENHQSVWSRMAVACAASAILFLGIEKRGPARWTEYAAIESLDQRRPEHAGWVPEPGGIIYAVEPSVFYETFFTNPKAEWRYVLGFEFTFMRAEDLAIYTELCRTRNVPVACEPWVRRMRPADRFILRAPERIRPAIPQLEWFYAAPNTWVGRLPR